MKLTDTLRGLLRRWYIVIPGLIITTSLALGAWFAISPGYYRSATQLLLPGAGSVPDGANPYLFLGGLAPAADVLVRALGSENVLKEMDKDHPGVEIKISRDTTTAGPIILIAVTASSDADAKDVLGLLVDRTGMALQEFQRVENIPKNNRMTVVPVTIDRQSEPQQRTRFLGVGVAAIGGTALTLFIAGLVDGMSQQRKRRTDTRRVEADYSDGDDDGRNESESEKSVAVEGSSLDDHSADNSDADNENLKVAEPA